LDPVEPFSGSAIDRSCTGIAVPEDVVLLGDRWASEVTNPTHGSHGSGWMVQIQPVRPKEGPMKLNSLLNALSRFVLEAGSEQSTNFRWWDSRTRRDRK